MLEKYINQTTKIKTTSQLGFKFYTESYVHEFKGELIYSVFICQLLFSFVIIFLFHKISTANKYYSLDVFYVLN
jgi:hypothetical protein